MRRLFQSLAVAVAILLAFAVRAWDLGVQSFWDDEGYTLLSPDQAGWDIPSAMPLGTFSLYYHLVHSFAQRAGESEFALRYPSLFAGVALVAVAFALGRRLGNPSVGIATAVLVAISPPLIEHSRSARPYALVALLMGLNLYAVLHVRDDAKALRWWAVAVATIIAAAYSHLYALTALPAMLLILGWAAWCDRSLRRRFALLALCVMGSITPWTLRSLSTTYTHVVARTAESQLSSLAFADAVFDTLVATNSSLWGIDTRSSVGGAAVLGFVIGVYVLCRRSKNVGAPAVVYALAPILAAYAVYLAVPYFAGRYLLFVAPAFYLVTVGTLAVQKKLYLAVLAIPLLVIVGNWAPQVYQQVFAASRENVASLAEDLRLRSKLGDVLISNSEWRQMNLDYYLRGLGLPVVVISQDQPATVEEIQDVVANATHGSPRVWVAFFGASPDNPTQAIEPSLSDDYARISNTWYGTTRLALYERLPGPSRPSHSVDIVFGNALRLISYEPPPFQFVDPGGSVVVHLRWLLLSQGDYAASLRLVDRQGRIWAQADDRPRNGYLSTSTMPSSSEIDEVRGLWVPWGTPPGDYDLRIAVYDAQTGTEMAAQDIRTQAASPVWTLGRIEVGPATAAPPPDLLTVEKPTIRDFGNIRLLGGTWPEQVSAGEEFEVDLLWQAQDGLANRAQFQIELVDDRGQVWGKADEQLKPSRSIGWLPGEVLKSKINIRTPAVTPPGDYRMQLLVFREVPEGSPLRESTVTTLGAMQVEGRQRQFTVPRMQRHSGEVFGDMIELLGYDIGNAQAVEVNVFEVEAGDQVPVTLFWRISSAATSEGVDRNYTVFVQVLDGGGRVVAQHDGFPVEATAPTATWVSDEVVTDAHVLSLPPDLPPGVYSVISGLYDSNSMERLSAGDKDHLVLVEMLVRD